MANFKSVNHIKLDFIKSAFTGLALPLACLFLWYKIYPSTLNEFLLLTNQSKIAVGKVIKVEEVEDVVELYEGKKTEKALDFNFEYNFQLPTGEVITSFGSEHGALPEDLLNVNNTPFPIKVEYLPSHPDTNKIIASWTGERTFLGWFRHKFLIGLLIFLGCCYISLQIYKKAKLDYKTEMDEYDKILKDYRAQNPNS